MNVAMYETDGFHQDCTLIGEDVLREAGIETTSAKREGPYTYKRTPKHRSHPYTLRDDMVYQTLRSLTATEIGAGTVNVAKMVGGGSLCLYVSKSSTGCLCPPARPERSSLISLNGFSRKPVGLLSGLLTPDPLRGVIIGKLLVTSGTSK